MAGIIKKNLDEPDETYEFVHGRSLVVRVNDEEIWLERVCTTPWRDSSAPSGLSIACPGPSCRPGSSSSGRPSPWAASLDYVRVLKVFGNWLHAEELAEAAALRSLRKPLAPDTLIESVPHSGPKP